MRVLRRGDSKKRRADMTCIWQGGKYPDGRTGSSNPADAPLGRGFPSIVKECERRGRRKVRVRKEGTHVGVVELVGELDEVSRCGLEVHQVLRDQLGAVEVLLRRDEELGRGEDGDVRVNDPNIMLL